ncbi:hypothetical protein Tco_0617405 [Tanacetum coccineum]
MTFNVLFKDDDNENDEVHIDKEHHTSLESNLPNNEDSATQFKKLKKEMNTIEVALLGAARQAQLTMPSQFAITVMYALLWKNSNILQLSPFVTLAANYLNIHNDHWRFREIEDLIRCKKVTPVEVAEELMKSNNAEVVLEGLVKFLEGKNKCARVTTTKGVNEKGDEVVKAKTGKL